MTVAQLVAATRAAAAPLWVRLLRPAPGAGGEADDALVLAVEVLSAVSTYAVMGLSDRAELGLADFVGGWAALDGDKSVMVLNRRYMVARSGGRTLVFDGKAGTACEEIPQVDILMSTALNLQALRRQTLASLRPATKEEESPGA